MTAEEIQCLSSPGQVSPNSLRVSEYEFVSSCTAHVRIRPCCGPGVELGVKAPVINEPRSCPRRARISGMADTKARGRPGPVDRFVRYHARNIP